MEWSWNPPPSRVSLPPETRLDTGLTSGVNDGVPHMVEPVSGEVGVVQPGVVTTQGEAVRSRRTNYKLSPTQQNLRIRRYISHTQIYLKHRDMVSHTP